MADRYPRASVASAIEKADVTLDNIAAWCDADQDREQSLAQFLYVSEVDALYRSAVAPYETTLMRFTRGQRITLKDGHRGGVYRWPLDDRFCNVLLDGEELSRTVRFDEVTS